MFNQINSIRNINLVELQLLIIDGWQWILSGISLLTIEEQIITAQLLKLMDFVRPYILPFVHSFAFQVIWPSLNKLYQLKFTSIIVSAKQSLYDLIHHFHKTRCVLNKKIIIKEKDNLGIACALFITCKDNSCRLYWHGALFLVELRPVVTSVDEVQVLGLDMLGKVLDVQTTGWRSCLVVLKHRQHSLI